MLILAGWLLGILSPVVLFFADMFPPGGHPPWRPSTC